MRFGFKNQGVGNKKKKKEVKIKQGWNRNLVAGNLMGEDLVSFLLKFIGKVLRFEMRTNIWEEEDQVRLDQRGFKGLKNKEEERVRTSLVLRVGFLALNLYIASSPLGKGRGTFICHRCVEENVHVLASRKAICVESGSISFRYLDPWHIISVSVKQKNRKFVRSREEKLPSLNILCIFYRLGRHAWQKDFRFSRRTKVRPLIRVQL